jgi:ATP-dependent protease ClpP protease subunit
VSQLAYRFVASAGEGPAELFLYNEISGFGTTAERFQLELHSLGSRPLTVRINSIGGRVVDSIAIYNLLASRPNTITQVDGLAASAAFIVANAGRPRRMASNAWMMTHNPVVAAEGDERSMRSAAEALIAIKSSLVGTLAKRTGRDPVALAAMMDAETWMTADQAKAEGFVDEITEPFTAEASLRISSDIFNRFSRCPDAVRAQWGLPPQNTNGDIMSKISEFLESFKRAPSEREVFLATLVKEAGVDPDEAVNAKDEKVLSKLVEASILKGLVTLQTRLDQVTAALKTVDLDVEKITEIKATLDSRIETEASRKLQAMASARGILPVRTDGQSAGASERPKTATEQCLEAHKTP